jgi:hypothetical protein
MGIGDQGKGKKIKGKMRKQVYSTRWAGISKDEGYNMI